MAEPRNWKPRKPKTLPQHLLTELLIPLVVVIGGALLYAWIAK